MIKVIGLVQRHAPAAASSSAAGLVAALADAGAPVRSAAPGLQGSIVSEVLGRDRGQLDAAWVVEQWWDGDHLPETLVAGLAEGEQPWSFWATREHVLRSPDADRPQSGIGTRLKVLGTAYRRHDFSVDAFFAYWRDVHGPISAKAPGLLGYVVSEVLSQLGDGDGVDGFVEQWWPDEDTYLRASDSPEVAVAWEDVQRYAQTTGTFWRTREHVLIAPRSQSPGLLE